MRLRYALFGGCGVAALTMLSADGYASETVTYAYDALGRLVQVSAAGGANNGIVTAACFDAAGNRTSYASGAGAPPSCGPTPTPSSSPTPTPTSNLPPVTTNDYASLQCYTSAAVNVTNNDSDPENNVPLVLQSITVSSNPSSISTTASVASSSVVSIQGGGKGTVTFTYVVADSLGATSTGQLIVTTVGTAAACGGGGGPEP